MDEPNPPTDRCLDGGGSGIATSSLANAGGGDESVEAGADPTAFGDVTDFGLHLAFTLAGGGDAFLAGTAVAAGGVASDPFGVADDWGLHLALAFAFVGAGDVAAGGVGSDPFTAGRSGGSGGRRVGSRGRLRRPFA